MYLSLGFFVVNISDITLDRAGGSSSLGHNSKYGVSFPEAVVWEKSNDGDLCNYRYDDEAYKKNLAFVNLLEVFNEEGLTKEECKGLEVM